MSRRLLQVLAGVGLATIVSVIGGVIAWGLTGCPGLDLGDYDNLDFEVDR